MPNHIGALDSQHQFSRMLNEERLRKDTLSPMLTVHDDDTARMVTEEEELKERRHDVHQEIAEEVSHVILNMRHPPGYMGTPAFTLGADKDCIRVATLAF